MLWDTHPILRMLTLWLVLTIIMFADPFLCYVIGDAKERQELRENFRWQLQQLIAGYILSAVGVGVFPIRGEQLTVPMLVIFVAIVAHVFKSRHQIIYGWLEIGIGVISAFSISAGLPVKDALGLRWAALFGCTFIVLRGYNNISVGLFGDKPNPDSSKSTAS